jgi:hypothetical protein
MKPAPDSIGAYLADGHQQLTEGSINTIDRFRGWHTDRIRAVLDGSDAITFEGCGYDTFAGNTTVISDNHALHAALFTALEAKAIKRENIVEQAGKELGLDYLPREKRLQAAHQAMLEVSRYGTDAQVYGKKPGKWLETSLFGLAEQAPYIKIDVDRRLRLLGNFATLRGTIPSLLQWCRDNKSIPAIQAYHDLKLNAPAVYMRLQHDSLACNVPSQEKVRQIELATGQAFHQHVGRLSLSPAT